MMDPRHGEGETLPTNAADQSLEDSTRNDEDAQNNAPNGTSATDELAPSKATSKSSSTRNSTPATTSIDVSNSAQFPNDASSTVDAMQESRDEADDPADPALASSKDSEENSAAPSQYGTRSRNRTGRSRPNYAEDTEMDFEMTAASNNGTTAIPPLQDAAAVDSAQSSGASGKKGSAPAQGNASWGNSGPNPKDNSPNPNIPGAPAVAVTKEPSAAQPPLKRRKNAANANGNQQSASAPSQTGPKRGSQVMVAASSARETNMLLFENTGAILKDGHMEADDGQTVCINGKFALVFPAAEGHYVAPATSCGFFYGF
jgi:hypothetical protein